MIKPSFGKIVQFLPPLCVPYIFWGLPVLPINGISIWKQNTWEVSLCMWTSNIQFGDKANLNFKIILFLWFKTFKTLKHLKMRGNVKVTYQLHSWKNGFQIQINTEVQESKTYFVYLRNYFTFKLNFLKVLVCQRKQSRQNKFLSVRLRQP